MKKILNKTLGIGIVGLTLLSTSGFIVGATNNELDSNYNTNAFRATYNANNVAYDNDFDYIGLTYDEFWHEKGTDPNNWIEVLAPMGNHWYPTAFFVMEATPTKDNDGNPATGASLKSNYIFKEYPFGQLNTSTINITKAQVNPLTHFSGDWVISTSLLTPGYEYYLEVLTGACTTRSDLDFSCLTSTGFQPSIDYGFTSGNYAYYNWYPRTFKHDYETTGLVEITGTLTHTGSNFYWIPDYNVSSTYWDAAPEGTFTITHQVARVDDDSKVGNPSIPNTVEYDSVSKELTVNGNLNELNISSAISHNGVTSAYEWNPDYKIVTTIEFVKDGDNPLTETFFVENINTIPNDDGIYFATENDVVINNNIFKAIDGLASTTEFIIDQPDYAPGSTISAPAGTYELVYTIDDDSSTTWTDTIEYDPNSVWNVTYDPQYDNNQLNVTSLINYDEVTRKYVWKKDYSVNAQMTFTPDDPITYSTFSKSAVMVEVKAKEKVPINVVSTNDIEIKMMINNENDIDGVLTMENEYTTNNYIGSEPGTYEYEYTISYNIADSITWTDIVVYNENGTLDVTHGFAGDNEVEFIDDDMIVLYDDIAISVNVTYYTAGSVGDPELPSEDVTDVLIIGNPGFDELSNKDKQISDEYLISSKTTPIPIWVWIIVGVGAIVLIGGTTFGIIRSRKT